MKRNKYTPPKKSSQTPKEQAQQKLINQIKDEIHNATEKIEGPEREELLKQVPKIEKTIKEYDTKVLESPEIKRAISQYFKAIINQYRYMSKPKQRASSEDWIRTNIQEKFLKELEKAANWAQARIKIETLNKNLKTTRKTIDIQNRINTLKTKLGITNWFTRIKAIWFTGDKAKIQHLKKLETTAKEIREAQGNLRPTPSHLYNFHPSNKLINPGYISSKTKEINNLINKVNSQYKQVLNKPIQSILKKPIKEEKESSTNLSRLFSNPEIVVGPSSPRPTSIQRFKRFIKGIFSRQNKRKK